MKDDSFLRDCAKEQLPSERLHKEIPLTKGTFAIVDEEDYGFLMKWNWQLVGTGYAQEGTHHRQYMHRLLMQPPKGKQVDHINGNKLDNRRCNLRICSHGQNIRNQKKQSGKSSQYKGVSWSKVHSRWRAKIKHCNVDRYLGYFKEERDAAVAYNKAAVLFHGEFARLNEVG